VIFTIGLRELKSLFLSPLAWAVLVVMQVIYALIFFNGILAYLGSPDPRGVTATIITPVFAWAAVLLLFVIPLLTMRLIAEERRNKTLALLFSAPVSMTEIVLGKYLGVVLFLATMLVMVLIMAASLLAGGTLDFGLIGAQALGLLLLLTSFTAVGLYISTRTESSAVAAVTTFGILLSLWLFEFLRNYLNQSVIGYLSIISHYTSFLEGTLATADVFYYLLFTALFLVLSIRRLDAKRLGV
jgi:ABC-2 type transport system permease protein